jgi:hypothetical protein
MEESSSCSKIIGTPTVINLHFERAATNIMREDNKETLLSHIGVALNVCGSSVTVWTSETVSIIEEL